MKKKHRKSIGSGLAGPGRPAGSPNRVTAAVRERFADLLADNQPRLQEWLDRVAAKDPKAALEVWLRMAEFAIPKPARVQQHDPDGETKPLIGLAAAMIVASNEREREIE